MADLHGLIYAFHSSPALGDLVMPRTSASLPFCSRYRLIDFALSSMANAGVRGVGVIMQRDYQSLLDHMGSGKDWDLSRLSGGLRLLPPFGMHGSSLGEYKGGMEALSAVRAYINDIKQNYVVIFRGDLAANIDLKDVFDAHLSSGCQITAVCAENACKGGGDIRFIPDTQGNSKKMLFSNFNENGALSTTEVYVINKSLLVNLVDWCHSNGKLHFHRDALTHYLNEGGTVGLYVHKGYTARICSVSDYYSANMDMLKAEYRNDLFNDDNPIYTKGRSSVSTYYGEDAFSRNSLVADGCYIEGELTNCVLFRGVRVKKGAKLKDCVIMQDSVVGENVSLSHVIADKYTVFSDGLALSGSHVLPIIVPKCKII
ncbi:MAG: glucose-1-phosphate adenylyltransferase subunit GlgD [Firmicutes bacterium HGW-Firmicutes-16]|nr:MAG: glucose-1-phosphate adenylyltransferase subunit GlgD [Firmicutes bacterium HGW-Firmicutes-16]